MNTRFGKNFGYASKLDLLDTEWKYLYTKLELEQNFFLENSKHFRGKDYKWPHDALHNWSRVWEYPYIYSKFLDYKDKLKVMDFGSGVTFFPYALSKLGHDVVCIDNDPICRRDNIRASQFFSKNENYTGRIIVPADGEETNDSADYDIIYSISVLEHIEDPSEYINFFYKNLKPDGRLLLTMDIDLRGGTDLSPEKLENIKKSIEGKFSLCGEFKFTHPRNYLSTANSTYPYDISKVRELKRLFKRFFLGKNIYPYPMISNYLCILSLDMVKI